MMEGYPAIATPKNGRSIRDGANHESQKASQNNAPTSQGSVPEKPKTRSIGTAERKKTTKPLQQLDN